MDALPYAVDVARVHGVPQRSVLAEVGLGGEKEFEGYVCGLGRVVQEFLGVVERRKFGAELRIFVNYTTISILKGLE